MRTCKIILIVLLVIKSVITILQAIFCEDDDREKLVNVGRVFITLPLTWGLYWGAGLLDL
jgi:hypothetical protein